MVFPRRTDCVSVVAPGELTLCERLINCAADVVARLICKMKKISKKWEFIAMETKREAISKPGLCH